MLYTRGSPSIGIYNNGVRQGGMEMKLSEAQYTSRIRYDKVIAFTTYPGCS